MLTFRTSRVLSPIKPFRSNSDPRQNTSTSSQMLAQIRPRWLVTAPVLSPKITHLFEMAAIWEIVIEPLASKPNFEHFSRLFPISRPNDIERLSKRLLAIVEQFSAREIPLNLTPNEWQQQDGMFTVVGAIIKWMGRGIYSFIIVFFYLCDERCSVDTSPASAVVCLKVE